MRGQRARLPAARARPRTSATGFIDARASRARASRGAARRSRRCARSRRAARDEPSRVGGDRRRAASTTALALAEALGDALAEAVARHRCAALAAQRRLAGELRSDRRACGAPPRCSKPASDLLHDERVRRRGRGAGRVRARRQAAAGRRRARHGPARAAARARRRGWPRDGWMTFEAGAAEVNAGMTYVGELEGRVRHLVQHARRRAGAVDRARVRGAAVRGRDAPEPAGRRARPAARRAWPTRRCTSPAIVDPARYERLVRARPAVRDAFDVVRVEPMDEPRTLALAAPPRPARTPRVLREALALGRHFLGDAALPGALLSLLEAMRRRRPGDDPLAMTDVLATITERSGLPRRCSTSASGSTSTRCGAFFARARDRPAGGGRVHGRAGRAAQGGADRPDAPAGRAAVRRPDRARARPRSPRRWPSTCSARGDRMIRLDMSEYQNPGSRAADARRRRARRRVAGRAGSAASRSSVVLLDEFEKAEPGVFDLFLQVFDDGRLSDPRGEAADFRHAVIIMTSNLGAKVVTGGLGFSPGDRVRRGAASSRR